MPRNEMTWVVAPGLVEIGSDRAIRGFSLCNFNPRFNDLLLDKYSGHHTLQYRFEVGAVDVSEDLDFRYQYYCGKLGKGRIYYLHKMGPFKIRMSYDLKNGVMVSNRAYARLPFEVGSIWPAGLHLSNIVIRDLLLGAGVISLHSCGFVLDGHTTCVFSPRRTGKSTLMRRMLQHGASYIGEDAMLTDGAKVYLTPPNDSQTMEAVLQSGNLRNECKVDEIVLTYPRAVPPSEREELAHSLISMYANRVPFFNDVQLHAMMMYEGRRYADLHEIQDEIIWDMISSADVRFIDKLSKWVK